AEARTWAGLAATGVPGQAHVKSRWVGWRFCRSPPAMPPPATLFGPLGLAGRQQRQQLVESPRGDLWVGRIERDLGLVARVEPLWVRTDLDLWMILHD